MSHTNPELKEGSSTWTASYKLNNEYMDRLITYYKLPWYKRLFMRMPKP